MVLHLTKDVIVRSNQKGLDSKIERWRKHAIKSIQN